MGKVNLDNIRGGKTYSVLSENDVENGALLGVGDIVEGEHNMYKAVEATADNFALVTTPEVHRDSNSSSIEFTNKAGVPIRVHLLESGDIFTVDTKVQDGLDGLAVNDEVGIAGGKFAAAGEGAAVAKVIEITTLGAHSTAAGVSATPAVALRML